MTKSTNATMLVIDTGAARVPPPPCGEGSGVGVSFRGTRIVLRFIAALAHVFKTHRARVVTPPLTPPRQGEGDCVCAPESA